MHTFKKGDKVVVLNTTMSGTVIVEGRATIFRAVPDVEEQYVVDFGDGSGFVERFVDPLAQDDAGRYVAGLNNRVA
jgi:hypothetical protein